MTKAYNVQYGYIRDETTAII